MSIEAVTATKHRTRTPPAWISPTWISRTWMPRTWTPLNWMSRTWMPLTWMPLTWTQRRRLAAAWLIDRRQFAEPRLPRTCPICGYTGVFVSVGHPPRWDASCLNCGSRERHRLLWLWVTQGGGNRLAGKVHHLGLNTPSGVRGRQ